MCGTPWDATSCACLGAGPHKKSAPKLCIPGGIILAHCRRLLRAYTQPICCKRLAPPRPSGDPAPRPARANQASMRRKRRWLRRLGLVARCWHTPSRISRHTPRPVDLCRRSCDDSPNAQTPVASARGSMAERRRPMHGRSHPAAGDLGKDPSANKAASAPSWAPASAAAGVARHENETTGHCLGVETN